MRIPGLSVNNSVDNKFLYNNKEFEDESNVPPMVLGFASCELRSGDSLLRLRAHFWRLSGYALQAHCWMAVDPADEFFSPYVYCHNDPVNFLDPDGAFEIPFTLDEKYINISRFWDGTVTKEWVIKGEIKFHIGLDRLGFEGSFEAQAVKEEGKIINPYAEGAHFDYDKNFAKLSLKGKAVGGTSGLKFAAEAAVTTLELGIKSTHDDGSSLRLHGDIGTIGAGVSYGHDWGGRS